MMWQDAVGLASLVVGVVGFAATLWQVVKARSAAEKARDAATVTVNELVSNFILVLLTQLQALEMELDNALRDKDVRGVERVLIQWRELGNQIRGLLKRQQLGGSHVLDSLQRSVVVAGSAKEGVFVGGELMDSTREIRQEIRTVNDQVGDLIAQISVRVSTESK